jgi:perosamine synthetase
MTETAELLSLRPGNAQDAEIIFAWRNMPEIVALGSSQRSVDWDEHQRWLQQTLHDGHRLLLIVMLDGKPIGQVRFDCEGSDSAVVSIYLLSGFTGRGLGVEALKQGCWEAFGKMNVRQILAHVRKDNERSLSAFLKAGFTVDTRVATELVHFTLNLRRPDHVPHNRLTYGSAEEEMIVRTVRTGYWASGPRVAELESALTDLTGVKHAVCVSSGLSAIRLALIGLGIRPGDRVIVPAYSCVALANATLACGAIPLPVEVTPGDLNLSVRQAELAIRENKPKAAIAVNTFGTPAPIEQMLNWGIPIIEDCAHALGIRVNGKALGARTDVAIISFYATKFIGSGEGGAVLTNSDGLATFIRSWRDYSDQAPDGTRLNDKMTDLEACLALCQLQRLQEIIHARQLLAEQYHEMLSRETGGSFRLPDISCQRIWYRYAVEMLRTPARTVVQNLERFGVYAALPVSDWRLREQFASRCPITDHAYKYVISLPLYPTLTEQECERVVHAFLSVCRL